MAKSQRPVVMDKLSSSDKPLIAPNKKFGINDPYIYRNWEC